MTQFIHLFAIYDIYDVNLFSITLRLVLAVLCGGVIGLERGSHKHQAGFRTHILVCVGATLAMLTNQYAFQQMSAVSDPTRLGAAVISGIGFLGVGTILVTGRHKIKGLTTAAGLWASACMGLALGIGFYSGAFIAGTLVFVVLALLPNVEIYFYNRSRTMDFYVELSSVERIAPLLKMLQEKDVTIYESHVSRSGPVSTNGVGLYLSIKIPLHTQHKQLLSELSTEEGILFIEEI